ncbi:YopX family protein [Streptococcus pyogenes]
MIPKFRAWDPYEEKMIDDKELVIWGGNIYRGDRDKIFQKIIKGKKGLIGYSFDDEYLMQSTGLKDKNEPHTTFMDVRQEKFEIHGKKINVNPDVIGDFRDMPFESNSFNLVVFDPPHLKYVGQNSIMKAQYGQLDKENWKEDISKGFEECMRVLKVGGTLVFKWSDCQVNVREVLSAIPFKPLFGQQRGTTHWMTFVKFAELTGNGR